MFESFNQLMEYLSKLFHVINPYAKTYYNFHEQCKKNEAELLTQTGAPIYVMELKNVGPHDRVKNVPITDEEVAAVFRSDDGEIPNGISLFLQSKNGSNVFQEIKHMDSRREPLLFPILFPRGDDGFTDGIKYKNKKNKSATLTRMLYYQNMLSYRPNYFSPILRCGLLTQEYITEGYVAMETDRLNYQRQLNNNQSKENELEDFLMGDLEEEEMSKKIIMLYSSYIGSKRYVLNI